VKLSELQSTLSSLGASPTRSLGQNFLHDRNLADWITAQLQIVPGGRWLEIGPGLGALTEHAQRRSPNGILIEKDDRLIAHLGERFPCLELVHGDASRFDTRELMAGGPLVVFGNLPYYVSSQILFNFTADPVPARLQLYTLQRELAERLAAQPGSRDFGGPSAIIGRRWKVELLRTLPPKVFFPEPTVDSSVVLLTPRDPGELPACDGARFNMLVKLGFSQRRKQLGNLLGKALGSWPEAAAALGVPTTARAESLSISQWCRLAAWKPGETEANPAAAAQDIHGEIFDVVDAEDRVLGQASRHEVHTRQLRHRAIHIMVRNTAGEFFLQRRSRWKDVCPLKWDSSAAGHVNAGQAYPETAARELREELGVDAPLEWVAKTDAGEETGFEFVHLFEANHEGPFHLPPAEIDCGEWFTPAQIERWLATRPGDFAPGFRTCWSLWKSARAVREGTPMA
jgi:16S rRNA (adenine1518-N6/adenine1519-N6)-dimethyltransferase